MFCKCLKTWFWETVQESRCHSFLWRWPLMEEGWVGELYLCAWLQVFVSSSCPTGWELPALFQTLSRESRKWFQSHLPEMLSKPVMAHHIWSFVTHSDVFDEESPCIGKHTFILLVNCPPKHPKGFLPCESCCREQLSGLGYPFQVWENGSESGSQQLEPPAYWWCLASLIRVPLLPLQPGFCFFLPFWGFELCGYHWISFTEKKIVRVA